MEWTGFAARMDEETYEIYYSLKI